MPRPAYGRPPAKELRSALLAAIIAGQLYADGCRQLSRRRLLSRHIEEADIRQADKCALCHEERRATSRPAARASRRDADY